MSVSSRASPSKMDNYPQYSNQDLSEALQSLNHFRNSKGYQLLHEEYSTALLSGVGTVTSMVPDSISDFFLWMQSVGDLRQLKTTLSWTDNKIQDIKETLEKRENEDTKRSVEK